MKLKYKIKKREYPSALPCYIAQYRILGIWMNIDALQKGNLTVSTSSICENYEAAADRIDMHMKNMERNKEYNLKITSNKRII